MPVLTPERTDMLEKTSPTTLPTEPPANAENSQGSMLSKALRMLFNEGPAFTFRRAIWRAYFERFEKQRKQLAAPQSPYTIKFMGNDFELHQSNEGVSEEMRLYGVHEPEATELYADALKPGDHIFDVGSNLGYYLVLAAQKIGSQGRILGFEPAPGVYDVLERNIQRAGLKNVQVAPWAMSAKSGTLEFFESEIPNWGSFFQDSRLQQTKSTKVTAKTVDEVVAATPDFRPNALRMDVEGAELMVLEGARETMRKYRPLLFIEFHNFAIGWDGMKKTLLDMKSLGYSGGVMVERTWDQPWMGKWMRKRRTWRGDINGLIERVESKSDPLTGSTLILILTAPSK